MLCVLDEELEGLVGFEAVRKVQQVDWRRCVGLEEKLMLGCSRGLSKLLVSRNIEGKKVLKKYLNSHMPQCGVIQS